MRELPPTVRDVVDALIGLLETRLPGRLEAFYLVGSVAQNDYQGAGSDVDFVAVLAEPHDAAILAGIHAEIARRFPRRHCDGIYLRPGELSRAPSGIGISAREGRIDAASRDERHPVTWLLLADEGIALRGRAPDTRWIAADRDAAIAYSRANLDSYWGNWIARRRHLWRPAGLALLGGDAVTWGCLGIARLHATIATGHVPSKSGAGEYALEAFSAHALIIGEALRLRQNPGQPSLYRGRLARRRDLIAFMDAVLSVQTRANGVRVTRNAGAG